MATPLNDNYSVASGVTVYAGRFNRPSWRTSILTNTWGTIPGNTLQSLDPGGNPAMNPNYPGTSPWVASNNHSAIVSAWCGMAYDYDTDTMWFPLQGGHVDWAGNEPYKRSLRAATPDFVMLRAPSGAIGNLLTLNDGQEATGVFSDGRLRPGHSYNNNLYVPSIGPVIARVSALYATGNDQNEKTYKLNEATGEVTLLATLGSLAPGSPYDGYGAAEYDPSRNSLWMMGNANTSLVKVNLGTGAVTTMVSANNYSYGYPRLIYLPTIDCLLVAHGGGNGYPTSPFYLWDLTTSPPSKIELTITGTFSSGYQISGAAGMDWDAANNRLLLWFNNTNRTEISTLTPTGNLRSAPWAASTLTVSGSNSVTPTASTASGGVFGRFRYSSFLGGCLLINATDQPTYFFATE